MADLSNAYNTPLSNDEELAYQQWLASRGMQPGQESYDYDMRGFFKGAGAQADNGHFPDTFKKPNHPTFSNQSMYADPVAQPGGQWGTNLGGQDTFAPGAGGTWDKPSLSRYMAQVEPNAQLLPGAAPQDAGQAMQSGMLARLLAGMKR